MNHDQRPRMSVVMPNYNHAQFLPEALQAIAAQSVLPDEVIVVDDGSTDDSVARLEALTASLPWLRIIKLDQNRGVNVACNTGLAAATGDFVLFSAMDDRLDREMVARAADALTAFPNAGMAFSDAAEMKADGSEPRIMPLDLPARVQFFSANEFVSLLQRQFFFFSVSTVWFDINVLRKLGGFPPELRWHGDLFAAYAAAFQRGAVYVPRAVSYFRVLEQSYSVAGRRSTAQTDVLRAWHTRLKRPDQKMIRTAFVTAGVLPEFSLRSARALLREDPSYLTPRLAVRFVWLIAWTAIANYVPASWRNRLRGLRSSMRRGGPGAQI